MSTEFEIEVLSRLDAIVNVLKEIRDNADPSKVLGEIVATEPLEQTLKNIAKKFADVDSSNEIISKLQNVKQQMDNLGEKLNYLKQENKE